MILVRFDRPRSTQYAEFSSAKTFRDIATFLLQYYGLPPGSGKMDLDALLNTKKEEKDQ